MLDLKILVAEKEKVAESLRKRNMDRLLPTLAQVGELDVRRRENIQKVEALKQRKNAASQEIAKQKRAGVQDTTLLEDMKKVSQEVKGLDDDLAKIEAQLKELLFEFPNLLHNTVPPGESSDKNVEVRRWGKPPELAFQPLSHDDLGEKMGLLNFKKAGEVTGARFVFLKGILSQLNRALIQFMMDTHRKAGYEEMLPPFLVNRASLTGTGTLPKFEEDVFRIEKFDYFLIPTAEVPVTNYFRDEILEEKILPQKFVAYTPCFRSEAGSYGKDTKGLKRQHQFDKVELVKFTTASASEREHEALLNDAEKILQLLGLHYRVMALCGGDTGFSSNRTYDIEVWSPVSQSFMEISSCSNFTDFQARRANIRYRDSQSGKVQFAHTINGSGLAVGRTLLAILENFQTAEGSFSVPDVLQPYMR